MASFSAAIKAKLANRKVRVAYLIKMEFVSKTVFLWSGFGDLFTGGQTWRGAGDLIQVSNLEQPAAAEASPATFTLSGASSELVTLALAETDEYPNRPITVYFQFFQGNEPGEAEWQTLDEPYAIWSGLMDTMTIKRSEGEDGPVRSIALTAEGLFQDRSRPAYGAWSNSDQQARYLGDLGCSRVSRLVNKTVKWPVTY
jgi:hypothetical protein